MSNSSIQPERFRINRSMRKIFLLSGGLLGGPLLWAQAPAPSSISDPFVVIMIIIMAVLALLIALLAYVVLGSAEIFLDKQKQTQALAVEGTSPTNGVEVGEKKSQGAGPVLSVVVLLMLAMPALAQNTDATTAAVIGYRLSDTAFYTMTSVIFLELVVIGVLLYHLNILLGIRRRQKIKAIAAKPKVSWWDKLNKFKPVEQEADIDLGHDYDGIRELDNRLPPWWLYGFYVCIVFAVIYLWRYHVSHTAPSSLQEYELAVKEAEVKKAAFLAKAANNVDEHSVKLLTDANDLAAAQKTFQSLCAACHGKAGEGGVGPNLTDAYWLHGGSVNNIFKTIKYGVPEKGMKSWQEDFSPVQIAQLASYIHSLAGTNPTNGKAPQGDLYKEAGSDAAPAGGSPTTDSASTVVDQ